MTPSVLSDSLRSVGWSEGESQIRLVERSKTISSLDVGRSVERGRTGLGEFAPNRIVMGGMVLAVGIAVGFAVATGYLVQAVGIAVGVAAFGLSVRWPLIPLFAFATLIPVEEVVVLGNLGTLSRLAAILFIVTYGLPRLRRLHAGAMPPAAWGFVGWSIFSVGWAIDGGVALQQVPVLVLLFITAILIASAVVDRPTIVRPLLWAYSLSAGATAVVGTYKYLAGSVPISTNDRVSALQDQNPAYYATLLLPALIFCLFELIANRQKIVSITIAGASSAAILASGTRAAWLSAGLVIVGFVLPRISPGRRVAAIGLGLALSLVALQLPGISAVVIERADIALSSGGAGRTDIWSVGLTIYETAPLSGVGLGNFPSPTPRSSYASRTSASTPP